MVYSVFVCPESKLNWLADNGACDSKQLSDEARKSFFNLALNYEPLGWRCSIIHPEYISNCMLRSEKINLNELSYEAVYSIISSLLEGDNVRITDAFVDTLGKPEKYQAALEKRFPGIRFTVKSKADSLFPIVGAASIVAKVLRDDLLRQSGVMASGYPGDVATVEWLRENVDFVFGFPSLVRFSWSSCANLLSSKCCPVKWTDNVESSDGKKEGSIKKIVTTSKPGKQCHPSPFGFSSVASF